MTFYVNSKRSSKNTADMYLFNLFLSSLHLDKDTGDSINKPLVFAGERFKIKQQLLKINQ